MLKPLLALALIYLAATQPVKAEEKPFKATPAEAELIKLVREYRIARKEFHKKLNDVKDLATIAALEKTDPQPKFIERCLELEALHQGTDLGFYSIYHVVSEKLAFSVTEKDKSWRSDAYERLKLYRKRPDFFAAIDELQEMGHNPDADELLRHFSRDPDLTETCRAFTQLTLIRQLLRCRNIRPALETHCKNMGKKTGEVDQYFFRQWREFIDNFPKQSEQAKRNSEAVELMKLVVKNAGNLAEPTTEFRDPDNVLFRFDEKKSALRAKMSDIAKGMLFCEENLMDGQLAPELKVKLTDGKMFDLTAQKGKVVIIQFSFEGCGGCEALYPTLREMQKLHGDKLSILSIMSDDEEKQTTDAVAKGKLTWNVHWDGGGHGPIATKWFIRVYPTLYFVDKQGKIVVAESHLYDDELKARVAELIKN